MARNLSSAKLVAPPTEHAWAQAYTAGTLFAVLALTTKDDGAKLNALGKEIFSIFQSEYFSLEEKTLTTMKQAIISSTESLPETVTISFCVGVIKEQTLYVFVQGDGLILMKRGERIGTLLKGPGSEADDAIRAASGLLQPGDIVCLQTANFHQAVDEETLANALSQDSVADAAEALAPLVLDSTHGGSSAILFSSQKEAMEEPFAQPEDTAVAEGTQTDEQSEDTPESALNEATQSEEISRPEKRREAAEAMEEESPTDRSSQSRILSFAHLTSKRKLYLGIALLIFLILLGSVILTIRKKGASSTQKQFQQVYTKAQQQYDNGMGLVSLNAPLAQDDFQKAKTTIESNKAAFPEGSEERQKLDALEKKIDSQLSGAGVGKTIAAKEVADDAAPLLAAEKASSDALAAAQDDSSIYLLTNDAITRQDKSGGKASDLIKNDSDWTQAVGLGTYLSNFYVLDQKAGILKYVAAASGYGKTAYFTSDTKPDLSKASSLAIDGSIYILTSDGKILKFTKGAPDSFTLSGLQQPFSKPTRLYTDTGSDNLYVLDPGTSRIVKLSKTGTFQTQYQSSVLKTAKDFVVSEKDDTATVLSNNKLYQLSLN